MAFPDNYPGAVIDIVILKGSVFSKDWTFEQPAGTPIVLTDHTAALKIFDECGDEIVSLTDSSGITITGATGNAVIKMTSIATALLKATHGTYRLEFTETATSETTRALEGDVTISPTL